MALGSSVAADAGVLLAGDIVLVAVATPAAEKTHRSLCESNLEKLTFFTKIAKIIHL